MKLKQVFETEVYISEAGYLTIKQVQNDEESYIALSPEYAQAVCDEIQRLLLKKDDWWRASTPSESEDK